MDTIFALASAQGRAGVSVIRLSGLGALDLARTICPDIPPVRHPAVRALQTVSGDLIDHALVLRFDAPRSFTGEDIIEFQVHGSIAVVRSVLSELGNSGLGRLAEPGEFTRRALENEKLDLSQVEGLSDLIEAETEAQRKQAVRVLSGALGDQVERWRKNLIRAAALLEATIDFADEDVPVDVTPEVSALLSEVSQDLAAEIAGSFVAERIRLGFEVALVGPPNAGKSTLLNRLAGREAAITSEIAGTTRDVIEVRMDLNGFPVTFLDTAGLRDSDDVVEVIGIERAIARAKQADIRVFLRDNDDPLPLVPLAEDIVLSGKADLHDGVKNGISGKTGAGVAELLANIRKTLEVRSASAGLATHERHRVAMLSAAQDLTNAMAQLTHGPAFYDISAEELRSAIRALETLVGRVDVESLLDEIFSSFCLGK
ncbi:MAG: tRNA uridine-5-carboxymethylaminomethyl(34) synthesis GTPase MnmE [Roseobacter sp.]|jgi:tRNA modification GTPase|nr:tRNA uridine-5-carboxymethylaminomethyl(34) synthesis GTPase MnmE [Roseobacter sp.]